MAWGGFRPSGLEGLAVRRLEEWIGEEGRGAAEAAARTWSRLWGRLPLLDGHGFRDLVAWRGTSLLWLAEGCLHTETAGPRCAALAEAALRLLDATGAGEVEAVGLPGPETVLLARACTARGVLYLGPTPTARPIPPLRPRERRPAAGLRRLWAPKKPPALPAPWTRGSDEAPLVFVCGTGYDPARLRPLLEAIAAELGHPGVVVPAAELVRWETRDVGRRVAEAEAHLLQRFEGLRGAPGLHESYAHRGVRFEDLAAKDLGHLLLVHLPAAVRQLEAAVELFSRFRPAGVVVTGADRDERRTLLAACVASDVAGVVLRPTPPGPDEIDRADGGPRARADLEWREGGETAPLLARLHEVVRARVGPG